MTTSESLRRPPHACVSIWLPGADEPVLAERFDRTAEGHRRMMHSALTLLRLHTPSEPGALAVSVGSESPDLNI